MTTIREARTPFDGDPDEQALAALEQDMLNDDVPRPNTALEPAGGAAVEPATPAAIFGR